MIQIEVSFRSKYGDEYQELMSAKTWEELELQLDAFPNSITSVVVKNKEELI